MCGIVGIASKSPVVDRSWITTGCAAIRHRGPDDSGEWWSADQRVGMAHRRLAIIDLSPGGHQPMMWRGLSIVFNGEIYNYRELREALHKDFGVAFESSSDTEVLLAAYRAWGRDCVHRLVGMFAFAIFDSDRRVIFAARDRAGEKPFFYWHASGELRFASELKALLADPALPRRIDASSLDCYLAFGYVPGDSCILQGFRKLPPACSLAFDLTTGELDVRRYWNPPPFAEGSAAESDKDLLDECEALLEGSVRQQLVADVPVGVLLSGGVDSSLVTAMAVRAARSVKTFTIRFPGHAQHDETEHARLIARHFGTEHVELEAQPATAELMPELARQFDEPLVDSSMIPTFLVSRMVREHCTVALGGDGGDELFGGYPHHSRQLWMNRRLGLVPLQLRRAASSAAERLLPVGFRGRNWLQGLGTDFRRDLPMVTAQFDATTRRRLLASQASYQPVAERVFRGRIPRTDSLLQRTTRMDFGNYLPEDILVKVDRASMLCSLEVRAPFLDSRLIEFAYAKVPERLKTTPWEKKILLKQLTERVLPPEFDRQRKQGFSIPLRHWLSSGPWRERFESALMDRDCIFDRAMVRRLFEGQDAGRNNSERLFGLALFEIWRRTYRATL